MDDFIVIGSGFGGSVSAMRLAEKGYSVRVLERGKRFEDTDFPKSNWVVWKYLWAPAVRCFGILQISLLKGVMVLHGSGVGGGSLGYSNVLEMPDESLFSHPSWSNLANWHATLMPHYDTAKRMLGVTTNPRLWEADRLLEEITGEPAIPTEVGVYFGPEGQEVPDPFFGGEGPARSGCTHCGACMVGCRYNAKNTLVKNYLYFAEKLGVKIQAETEVIDVRPLPKNQPGGARYEVIVQSSTRWFGSTTKTLRTRNVIFSAGVIGTLKLLLKCRDDHGSLPNLSSQLGESVRTNSEGLLGSLARNDDIDCSRGVSISSIVKADDVTRVEPVRYPDGSSLVRFLSTPLISSGERVLTRAVKIVLDFLRHPIDFLRNYALPGWARRATILLIMQTVDSRMQLKLGRSLLTGFRRGLISVQDPDHQVPARIDIGHTITREFADKTGGVPLGSIGENLLNMPTTAHILGGCPIGRSPEEGVVDLNFEVFGYPGLFVVDGSVMPANPGINPSLTITAMAEYAMSRMPAKADAVTTLDLGKLSVEKKISLDQVGDK